MNGKALFDIVQTSKKLDKVNSGSEKDRVNSVANDSSFGASNDQVSTLNPPALQLKAGPNSEDKEGSSELETPDSAYQFVAADPTPTIHDRNAAGPFQLKAANKNPETESTESIAETQAFQLVANGEGTPSENTTSGAAETPPNNTGLPTQLKSGVENLSGFSLDDVKVHYNSDKPAQLKAHAYAQGTDIHLGAGQEKHLPHEAWHVVQQKQGRVKPTTQLKAFNINDDAGLEKEADVMGAKSNKIQSNQPGKNENIQRKSISGSVVQKYDTDVDEEGENKCRPS